MAQIEVIRDPKIVQTEIVHALRTPHNDGAKSSYDNTTEIQQSKVFGLIVPLLALNGVAIDWNEVVKFTLDDTKHIPTCEFEILNRQNIFRNYTHLGNDNELRVQILPQFDNTYKKIDLTFLITDIYIQDDRISGTGIYNLKSFTESKFKALGKITTYDLADKISLDTGLGFAANTKTTNDARYMQCSYESYKDIMSREIEKSGSDEISVYDWWVDCWNNLILCNLYDRINSEDTEDDMMIWVAGNTSMASVNNESGPKRVPALFTNHPGFERTDIYTYDFDVENNPVTANRGNSFAISVYEEDKKECVDHYVTDGDTVKNEFIKYEYLGEVYGEYNYFLAEKCRSIYLAKTKSEQIVIHIPQPQLGVMRGSQCRFVWYDNDTLRNLNQQTYEDVGAIATTEELAKQIGWLAEWIPDKYDNERPMRINLQYSGQYTSIGQYITYDGNNQTWDCWLYLVRPASKRPKISQIEDMSTTNNNVNTNEYN